MLIYIAVALTLLLFGTIVSSTGTRNQVVDGLVNSAAGVNFDSGVLNIYSGSPPGPDASETGTLLASITLPADAFGAAATGAAAKAGTWQDSSADGTGTAGYFRFRRSGDGGGSSSSAIRIEGTVTATGGGGDLTLDNTSIAAAQVVTITSFTLTKAA